MGFQLSSHSQKKHPLRQIYLSCSWPVSQSSTNQSVCLGQGKLETEPFVLTVLTLYRLCRPIFHPQTPIITQQQDQNFQEDRLQEDQPFSHCSFWEQKTAMVALVETKELDLKNLKGQKSEPTLFFHYFSFMLEWVKASIIFGSLVAQVNLLMHSSLESFFVTHTASQFMSSSLSVLILPSLFRLLQEDFSVSCKGLQQGSSRWKQTHWVQQQNHRAPLIYALSISHIQYQPPIVCFPSSNSLFYSQNPQCQRALSYQPDCLRPAQALQLQIFLAPS